MKDLLDLQTATWLVGVLCVVITTLVQKLSDKYKPWTWLAEQFVKAANKEMFDKSDTLSKKIEKLEENDTAQDKLLSEEKAKAARRRILRFADEVRQRVKHSEEYFDDVLSDITYYKRYCDDNPTFENEKAVIAIEIIRRVYENCHKENNFL